MSNFSGTFLKVSTFLLLSFLAAGCSAPTPSPFEATPAPSQTPLPESPTSALVEKFSIYLIAGGDRGRNGKPAGCNDSVIPVEWETEPTDQPLREAIDFLLSIKEERVGPPSFYNALYQSDLAISSIEIDSEGHASVRLSGEAVVNGLCDRLRFQAQLEETAKNSPGVRSAEILINGTPLEEAISNQ